MGKRKRHNRGEHSQTTCEDTQAVDSEVSDGASASAIAVHNGLLWQMEEKWSADTHPEAKDANPVPCWHFQCTLRLPLFLTFSTWKRHGYALSDVLRTLKDCTSRQLWHLAITFGILPTYNVVKPSFETLESVSLSSKAIIIQKITHHLKKPQWEGFFNQQSVLDTELLQHVPPIPRHTVTVAWYRELRQNLPYERSLLTPLFVKKVYRWKGVHWIPLYIDRGAICMNRVVTPYAFERATFAPLTWTTRPYRVFDMESQQLWLTVEECCVVVPTKSLH